MYSIYMHVGLLHLCALCYASCGKSERKHSSQTVDINDRLDIKLYNNNLSVNCFRRRSEISIAKYSLLLNNGKVSSLIAVHC